MSSGGGSSAPETTTTISKTEPPEYIKPYSLQMMQSAGDLASKPYEAYPDQRVAGLTPQHYAGLDMTTDRALQGSPAVNAANVQAANVLNNSYLNQGMELAGQQNPYEGVENQYAGQPNQFMNQTNDVIGQANEYAGRQNATLGQSNQYAGNANPYSGSNQYMEGMINRSQGNLTDQYNDVINPHLAAMDRTSGSFGNSGAQSARNTAQETLLEQLGDVENQYRFQDYAQQAQLAESGLNRNSQIAEAKLARDAQIREAGLTRDANLAESQIARDAQLTESDLSRNANLAELGLNRNSNLAELGLNRDAELFGQQQSNILDMYGHERANQMGAMQFAPTLGEQSYMDSQNLLGVGDIYRNADQQALDYNYDQWLQQQQYPYKQLDVLQGGIANSMGAVTSNVSSAPSPFASSNTAQNIGTGLSAYGLAQGLLS